MFAVLLTGASGGDCGNRCVCCGCNRGFCALAVISLLLSPPTLLIGAEDSLLAHPASQILAMVQTAARRQRFFGLPMLISPLWQQSQSSFQICLTLSLYILLRLMTS